MCYKITARSHLGFNLSARKEVDRVICLAQSNVFDRLHSRFQLPIFDRPFQYQIIDKLRYQQPNYTTMYIIKYGST